MLVSHKVYKKCYIFFVRLVYRGHAIIRLSCYITIFGATINLEVNEPNLMIVLYIYVEQESKRGRTAGAGLCITQVILKIGIL